MSKFLKKEDNPVSNNTSFDCNICFEKIKTNSKIATLKCSHIYHQECIQIWNHTVDSNTHVYVDGRVCPYCRT